MSEHTGWMAAFPADRRRRFWECMISAVLWGAVAHGMVLVRKFTFFDEANYLFSVGATTISGRWFLGILGAIVRWLFGSADFSLPLWSGGLTILLAGVCGFVCSELWRLEKKSSRVMVSGLLVTFPVVTSLLFYSFTAPYYMVGLLLMLGSAWALTAGDHWKGFLSGIVLGVLGLGIYQAFLPLYLCVLLIQFALEVLRAEQWDFSKLWKRFAWYCGACLVMLGLYLLSIRISTAVTQERLTDYKGLSSMGSTGPMEYLHRVKLAYLLFFFPEKAGRDGFILPYHLKQVYLLTILLSAGLGISAVVRCKNWAKAASLLAVGAAFPLATNFIYVMCAEDVLYTLMLYGVLGPFLLLVCLNEQEMPELRKPGWLRKIAIGLIAMMCVMCVRVDNAAYTQAEMVQNRVQSYYTRLITRIQQTPGYTEKTPIAFVGEPTEFTDTTFRRIDGFAELPIAPLAYTTSPFCTGYTWPQFMELWCGFTPPMADGEDFEDKPEVQAMPRYPDDGSIQLVDGTIVVKLK